MQKKRFLIDSFLNIISISLPLLILQLLALPFVANKLGEDEFGIVITIISILTVISFPVGNVLNNIRLLRNETYLKESLNGDFNYLLFGTSLITAILMIVFSILFLESLSFYNLLLLVFIVVLSIFKEYLSVSYRIILNFNGILLNNIFLSIGYIIGTGLFYITGYWEYIYLVGLIMSMIYMVFTTSLLTEPFIKTKLFKTTFKDFLILYGSGLLKNFLNYADKIILLPLLGPINVSIYYAASILSKIILMLFNPINSVILSYIAKVKRVSHEAFIKGFSVVTIVGITSYFTTLLISPYYLNFFYKNWADESMELIYITGATGVISVMSSVFHPFNLRYNDLKWQFYMSSSNLIFYLFTAYFFTSFYGLIGFTIAVLLSAIFRFIFQLSIYMFKY